MIENLLDLYSKATQDDISGGQFYYKAHVDCLRESKRLNVDYKCFVYAVAALSPQLYWEVNIKAVCQLVESGSTNYGFPKNRVKALAILGGYPELLSGDKVTRFAKNILNPNKYSNEVVIDRHAMRAAYGTLTGDNQTPTNAQYIALVNEYREASRIVGLKPGIFQAITWAVIRRLSHAENVANRKANR